MSGVHQGEGGEVEGSPSRSLTVSGWAYRRRLAAAAQNIERSFEHTHLWNPTSFTQLPTLGVRSSLASSRFLLLKAPAVVMAPQVRTPAQPRSVSISAQ